MPGMKATGINTDSNTKVIAMIGAVICCIAALVASAGDISGCSAIMCSTASTTTIASSTTIPIASTSANSEIVLAENPSASIAAKAPTSATGTAMIGTNVARRLPRKTKTTMATSAKASTRVETTLWIEAVTKTVVS